MKAEGGFTNRTGLFQVDSGPYLEHPLYASHASHLNPPFQIRLNLVVGDRSLGNLGTPNRLSQSILKQSILKMLDQTQVE